jgi:sigma-70-like protein
VTPSPTSWRIGPQARGLVDRLAGLTTDADRHSRDAADHVIARDQALAALRALPPKEAEAVTLTAWHGLEPADPAGVAGCSRTAFVVRLHRGRRRLARALDGVSRSRHGRAGTRPARESSRRSREERRTRQRDQRPDARDGRPARRRRL